TTWAVELGVALAASSAVFPEPAFAPRLSLALLRTPTARRVAFSVRMSFARAQSGTLPGTAGDADLTWTTLRAEACSMRWPGAELSVELCGSFDLGELRGAGSRAADSTARGASWAAPGALA